MRSGRRSLALSSTSPAAPAARLRRCSPSREQPDRAAQPARPCRARRRRPRTRRPRGRRRAVSQIVGRDPEALDEAGVAAPRSRASRRISPTGSWRRRSGWRSPACRAARSYKAINTADSMVGHRTPRHEAFGWAAARLDDLVNLPASRLRAADRRRRRADRRGRARRGARSPRRTPAPLAQCRLAGSGDGGRARPALAGPRVYDGVAGRGCLDGRRPPRRDARRHRAALRSIGVRTHC